MMKRIFGLAVIGFAAGLTGCAATPHLPDERYHGHRASLALGAEREAAAAPAACRGPVRPDEGPIDFWDAVPSEWIAVPPKPQTPCLSV